MTPHKMFQKGVKFVHEKNTLSALSCFEKAIQEIVTPELQSYLGYCIAKERGRIAEALSLCSAAIEIDRGNPVHYLNLGKVYLTTGRKTEALEAFRRGLAAGEDAEIRALLTRLGTRKKPVFPFLARENMLNRYGGLILKRLGLR